MSEKNFLKIYQIYFNDTQIPVLEFEGISNQDCTEFFEASVIRDAIESGKHLENRYFGILPPKFIEKRDWINNQFWSGEIDSKYIIDTSSQHQTKKNIIKSDVVSFTHQIIADPITDMEYMHKNIALHFSEIMNKIGYDWKPAVFRHVIYSNLFIAKSEIYERFVKEMLAPAMDLMKGMPELWQDSGYPKPLPKELQQKFGCQHYPYHSFICERMISYYIHIHNLNCKHF
jgi:hypothetical protein